MAKKKQAASKLKAPDLANPYKPGAGHSPPCLAGRESESAEFAQFLAVVDAALAAPPRGDGSRQATTPLVSVVLRPTNDGVSAQVRTTSGTLTMPDHVLEIGLARRAARAS